MTGDAPSRLMLMSYSSRIGGLFSQRSPETGYMDDDILIATNQHWDQVVIYYHGLVVVDSALYLFCYFLFQM